MSDRRSPTIRGRLALLVVASATPVVLLAAALLAYNYRTDRERLEASSIATARAMVHAIDRELASLTTAGEVLATSLRLQQGDFEAFRGQAEQVAGHRIGSNIVVSDADGRQLMNTLRRTGEPLPMHGNPAQLEAVFATKRPVISDLYMGGVLKRPVMSVDVPVVRDGKVVYDLSIGAVPGNFLAVLNEQNLPEGWIGVVFDRNGTIVARTREQERFAGQKGASELIREISRRPEGAIESVTLEGIPVISAFSRSPTSGWSVALGIPREAIAGEVRQRTVAVGAAAAVVLAIGLALAYAIGGDIADSIRALVRPAAEIGRREEIEVPSLGFREADEVGEALVRAARMIAVAQHRAQHDPLTGLANRSLFMEMAAHNLEAAKRTGAPLSVLFVDLDGFKQVNDTLGHEAGDQLLCGVGERLKAAVRSSDVVARMGGDEFAVLLPDVDADASATLAFKISSSLAEPYALGERSARVTASVGAATNPRSGATAHELVNHADEAMYRAKAAKHRVKT